MRFSYLVPACLCLALLGCKHSPPADVAASVNNVNITYDELDKAHRAQFSYEDSKIVDDQVLRQKLEVLRSLIDSEIMLQRAEKLSLMATDADVDAKVNEFKAPFTQEEFDKELAKQNMKLPDLRKQLHRDLSIQKLFNKEITSKINITDKDVSDFYNANRAGFNFPEPQIHVARILVTPMPDPNVRNLKNDNAQNEEQARKKVEMLGVRLKQGEDFGMVAQNYSEDPESAPNGGDMGFVPMSAFDKANPEVKKVVLSLQPGQIGMTRTQEGYSLWKVVSKEAAGQRPLEDPRVQQSIRETLRNRKEQLQREAYLEVARNDAKVVNYFARQITDRSGIK